LATLRPSLGISLRVHKFCIGLSPLGLDARSFTVGADWISSRTGNDEAAVLAVNTALKLTPATG
jgi:hypothetical protein